MSAGVQTKVQASPAQTFSPVGTGLLQRKCTLCNTPGLVGERSERDEDKLTLQRSPVDQAEHSSVPPILHELLRSPGQPLDAATRAYMEPRFGHDFSRVRVHTDVSKTIQTKLIIGQPDDWYEQEADRVAEQVMRMPELRLQRQVEPDEEEEETLQTKPLAVQITPLIQRQIDPEEEKEEEGLIQAKETSGQTPQLSPILQNKIHSLRGGGQPLPPSLRNFFEPRFGHDFSQVRIHTEAWAGEIAQDLNSQAFTMGRDIVFSKEYYAPGTVEGKRLLAHELTHTVQQGRNYPSYRGVPGREDDNTAIDGSSNEMIQSGPEGAPDISRAQLDVREIGEDIADHMDTHPDLISWLHMMGDRSGHVAHAAACPSALRSARPVGQRFDSPTVPTDTTLPINAYFFPSPLRTDQRALILGGIHGSEIPGYQMVEALRQELQNRTGSGNFVLAFHTLIIPEVNRGAIEDKRINRLWCSGSGNTQLRYNARCNRQDVDLNRNFPVPGASGTSPVCHSSRLAPVQPETQGMVNVIRDFLPHRILSTHAISNPASAGIFADPNTHPGATALACSMAGMLQHPSDRPANRLPSGQCNAIYPGDRPGALPSGRSLGRYAWRLNPEQAATPIITLEAPGYGSLSTGTGARTVSTFMRPLRGFISASTPAINSEDAAILRTIQAFSNPMRRLFLTGRLPSTNRIYQRIQARIQSQISALNALHPRPPNIISSVSGRRAFSLRISHASPQAQIVFEKFTLTGSKASGWDTLPTRYYSGSVRSRGVNRSMWLTESSAIRLRIILEYSAVPGASRHHWGTDVDFNSTNNSDWGATSGSGGRPGRYYRLGNWLQDNAARVGFVQVYTAGRSGGHHEEAWHYSYEPIAGLLRVMYNSDVRQQQDVVDPILADWTTRATRAGVTLPSDLRIALMSINLSNYVNVIGPSL